MFMVEHKARRSVSVKSPEMKDSNRCKRIRFSKNVNDMIGKPSSTKKLKNCLNSINGIIC